MTSREFRQRLVALASETSIELPGEIIEPLATYFELLSRWNSKINLTSLPLGPPSDEALRRLLLEPLEAAAYLPDGSHRWFDVGSGGGSPAIPMRLARPALVLSMVESRTRKAAFLRELIRVLGLSNTTVRCERFEDLPNRNEASKAMLVTLRAVRVDEGLVRAARRLIAERGELWIFCSTATPEPSLSPWFSHLRSVRLGVARASAVERYAPAMFHVEQSS